MTVDEEIDALLWNTHTLQLPDTEHMDRHRKLKVQVLKSGEGTRIRDLLASYYVHRANLELRYLGEGKRGTSKQDRVEEAVGVALDVADSPSPHGIAPRWSQVLELVGLGRAARLLIPGDVYFWDFPERGNLNEVAWGKKLKEWNRGGPLPITWLPLPAKSTFPASFGSIEDEAMAWKKLTWWELQEVFTGAELARAKMPTDQKDWQKPVMLLIHSNRKFVTYGVGDEGGDLNPLHRKASAILRSVEHRMGRSAIQISPGLVSSEQVPGRHWLSVIYHVRDLITSLDTRLSEMASASHADSFPMLKAWMHKNLPGDTGAPVKDRKLFGDGDIIMLNPGNDQQQREDIAGVFQPQYGEMTLRLIDFILDHIASMSAATQNLEGAPGPAGEPAWSLNDRNQQSIRRLKPLTAAITRMDVEDGDVMMRALAAFGEPVPLNLETGEYILQPSELEGWKLQLKGVYRPDVAQPEGANLEFAMSVMQRRREMRASFPSDTWLAEKFANIEQLSTHRRQTMEDDFASSPEMLDLMQKTLLNEAEAALSDDEGMSVEEAVRRRDEIGEEAFAMFMQQADPTGELQRRAASNGARGGPTSRPAGGQTPQNTLPAVTR